MKSSLLCLVTLFTLNIALVDAKVYGNRIISADKMVFLGKFCFNTGDKNDPDSFKDEMLLIEYTSKYIPNPSYTYVGFYTDEHWGDVYKRDLSCEKIRSSSQGLQKIFAANTTYKFQAIPKDYARPHYWYVAMIQCDYADLRYELLEYEITFKNTDGSHFSYDEILIIPIYVIAVIACFIVLLLLLVELFLFFKNTGTIPFIAILWTSLTIVEVISCVLPLIHWVIYAINGSGLMFLLTSGQSLDLFVDWGMMVCLLLLAQGWCVTSKPIAYKNLMILLFGILFGVYVIVILWAEIGVDPGSSNYMYATVPGAVLIIFRFVICGLFIFFSVIQFIQDHSDRRRFFVAGLFVVFLIWFVAEPAVALLNLLIPEYVRLPITKSMRMVTMIGGLAAMSIFLFPLWAHKIFIGFENKKNPYPTHSTLANDVDEVNDRLYDDDDNNNIIDDEPKYDSIAEDDN